MSIFDFLKKKNKPVPAPQVSTATKITKPVPQTSMGVSGLPKGWKQYAAQRSELIDDKSCEFCAAMDGIVVKNDSAWLKFEKFHKGCRGIWVGIGQDEVRPPKISVMEREDIKALFKLKRGK